MKKRIGACTALLVALALVVFPTAQARAGPTTIACTNTALTQAFATGGSYVYGASCGLTISSPLTLGAGTTLSLSAGGYSVGFNDPYGFGSSANPAVSRFATIDGTLTLSGVTLGGFSVTGTFGTAGTAGANGTLGTNGGPGQDGTAGGPGQNGTSGSDGQIAQGGTLLIESAAHVSLSGVTISNAVAQGGWGGAGGAGGVGGSGGNGGNGVDQSGSSSTRGGNGGDGAKGGAGGAGGAAGNGADGEGGAIFNEGVLTIIGSSFSGDDAQGGQSVSGSGADGGNGGDGGGGGTGGGNGSAAPGGDGGNGADGGPGGAGAAAAQAGSAYGGAIYSTGKLAVSNTTFTNNQAQAGYSAGGEGGGDFEDLDGGGNYGGPGGGTPRTASGGNGGTGGNGGDGGAVGPGDSAIGGAIYSTVPFTLSGGSTSGDAVTGFEGSTPGIGSIQGIGGYGGSGGHGYYGNAPNGAPGTPTPTGGGTQATAPLTSSNPDFYPTPNSGLTVTISPQVPPGGLAVGGTLSVPVMVTAGGQGYSNISLTLTPSGAGGLKISGTPAGTAGFSLAAGKSQTFVYTVTGTQQGQVTLSATARGTGADGSSASQTATTSFGVVQTALRITMAADPGKVRLDANDEGELQSKQIKVSVKLTNTTKSRLTSVQLLSLQPVPADATQQLDKLAFPKGMLPVNFGTLEPGAGKVKTLTLKVTGDGTYVINALALYANPAQPGINGRAVGQGGKFTVEIPLLYFAANKVDHQTVVDSGDSWYVSGHVKNLSSFQTLCLEPLAPDWVDNAGGLGPHQIGVVPVDEPAPAMAGPIKPGETISFLLQAQTENGGSGTSAVGLSPVATKGDPGDDCNVLKTLAQEPLPAGDVKLHPDSTKFRVAVAPASTGPPPFDPFEFFGGYAQGSAAVFSHLYESGVSICKQFSTLDGLVSAVNSGTAVASTVLSKLWHAAAVSAWFWYLATPEERQQFEQQVADAFIAKAGAVWDGTLDTIEKTTDGWMNQIEHAFMTGDWNSLIHALGEKSANVVNEQAITVAEWELAVGLISKVGPVARVISRASELESGALTSLKSVPIGRILNFSEMQRLWGLAYEDYLAFSKIADEEGVLIGVRGRAPISVKNLDEGAVWKHENLKPKNVNSIDTQWLGFPASDMGTVAFRVYTPEQRLAIVTRIGDADLDLAQKKAILKRVETRFGEVKYLDKIEHFSADGSINVGFNYADNGLALDTTPDTRGFKLLDQKGGAFLSDGDHVPAGGMYYRPYQENPALDGLADTHGPLPRDASLCIRETIKAVLKLLCRVTGDMDGVFLTNLEGGALTEEQRIKVYNRLMAVGWQHPETLTWIQQGLFDFEDKTSILKGLELGGEAMMEFAPGNIVRAVYLNLAQSTITDAKASASNYFVAVLGGSTSYMSGLKTLARLAPASPF